MKKALVMLVLFLAFGLAGCSTKNTDDSTSNQETQVETTESSEGDTAKEDNGDNTTSSVAEEVETSNNDTAVYVNSAKVADVNMGACVNGEQTVLCAVKLPADYYMTSLYMDEYGQSNTMLETNGKLLEEVAKDGALENCEQVPATVVMTAQGDANNSYTFAIVDSSTISVESEKDYAPGGIDVNAGSGHDAYAYTTSGQFDVVLVYEINDEWTLLIENSGQLKDTMSLEEIGQEFYNLVTPIG